MRISGIPIKKLFNALAMRGTITAAAADRRSDGNWHGNTVVIHCAKLGTVVKYLIHAKGQEISKHDFQHGAQSSQRHAVRNPQ